MRNRMEPGASGSGSAFAGLMLAVAGAAVATWAIRSFLAVPYKVDAHSMEPTLVPGDLVIAERLGWCVAAIGIDGVVVFRDPADPARMLIKRCLAFEGQTIDFQDGALLVDGKVLDEPYVHGRPSKPLPPVIRSTVSYPYEVPEDCLWVMGDNRTGSIDSRYFGAIPLKDVVGCVHVICWPPHRVGAIDGRHVAREPRPSGKRRARTEVEDA